MLCRPGKGCQFHKMEGPMYEANDSARRSYGLSNYIIGRGMSDSNKLVVILEQRLDDPAKAKELTASQGMKDRMKQSGVSNPTFTFLNVVMDDSSPIEQTARLMMTHKVKDWDAWKKYLIVTNRLGSMQVLLIAVLAIVLTTIIWFQ